MIYNKIVFNHLKKFWHNAQIKRWSWNYGRIVEEMPNFKVFSVKPKDRSYVIYFSSGIGKIINQEFFIISPYESLEHIETLARLASYIIYYPNSCALNYCVDIGKSWLDNSELKHFFISLPYTFGKKLEYMDFTNQKIRFFWLLPIREEEKRFLDNNSVELLESLFDKNAINYLDINRPSVI